MLGGGFLDGFSIRKFMAALHRPVQEQFRFPHLAPAIHKDQLFWTRVFAIKKLIEKGDFFLPIEM